MPCQTCLELRHLSLNGEMTPYTCQECELTSSSAVGKFKDEVDEDVVPFVGLLPIAYNYVDASTQTDTCGTCNLLQCDCDQRMIDGQKKRQETVEKYKEFIDAMVEGKQKRYSLS